jgi:hypothetical protein
MVRVMDTPEQHALRRRRRLDHIEEYWALLNEQDALNVRLNFLRVTGRTTVRLGSDHLKEYTPTRAERWEVVQEMALIVDRLRHIAQCVQDMPYEHGWSLPTPSDSDTASPGA